MSIFDERGALGRWILCVQKWHYRTETTPNPIAGHDPSSAGGSRLKTSRSLQTVPVSRRAEQLRLRVQQCVVARVEDSTLRTKMEDLESDEEDASRRVLWYKPMSWMGQIRTHHRDEVWSSGL